MRISLIFLLLLVTSACNTSISQQAESEPFELNNADVKHHVFLKCMYQDAYFPTFLVDKCKYILMGLCQEIEKKKPSNLNEFYRLTHAATDKLNDLQNEFFENNSEIETGARECLAAEFAFIAKSYKLDADLEKMIETREW